jgi:hypothetical protein
VSNKSSVTRNWQFLQWLRSRETFEGGDHEDILKLTTAVIFESRKRASILCSLRVEAARSSLWMEKIHTYPQLEKVWTRVRSILALLCCVGPRRNRFRRMSG